MVGAVRDVEPLLRWIREVAEPELRAPTGPGEPWTPGAYRRCTAQGSVDLYGSADLACVRWSLDDLPPPADRARWVEVLGAFQDPRTGWFVERGPATHVALHVTAYAVAALELLGAGPPHRLGFLDGLLAPEQVGAFLDARDWRDWAYLESHAVAGLASLVANAAALPPGAPAHVPGGRADAFAAAWLAGLDARLDPASGMHGEAKPPGGDLDQVGGTFHHAFCAEHWGSPVAHPRARIDAVLGLQRPDGLWDPANPHWLTLDGVWLVGRALEQTAADGEPHRADDVRAAVGRAVDAVLAPLAGEAGRRAALLDADMGSHSLVAVVSLLAEARRCLGPDAVRTATPLRLVLDRRPFV